MKILCVTRLFSGVESSLINREWKPTGVPTIFKMIEKFDQKFDLTLVFTSKDGFSNWESSKVEKLDLKGLKHSPIVLPGIKKKFRFIPLKIRGLFRELFQFFYCLYLYFSNKPDLIYIDHANTYTAAFFARFTSTPTVYRVMGVYPFMRNVIEEGGIKGFLFRFFYNSPFRQVVCTQDGSGVEPWLEKAINSKVPIEKLINGVDDLELDLADSEVFADIPDNKTKVLYVGKIETAKGAESYVKAMIEVLKDNKDIHAVMVGNGSKRELLINLVNENNLADHFSFIQRLPHSDILKAHQSSDIYVSLNRLGNLSVANLEAMKFGQCMIFPKSQPKTKVDFITDELISNKSAIRIESSDDIEGLKQAILNLHKSPEKIETLSKKMREEASRFIPTWEERVSKELEIIRKL